MFDSGARMLVTIFLGTIIASASGQSTNTSSISKPDCYPPQTQCILDATKPAGRLLSRPKRYLAFPPGSSFSVAFCSSIGYYGNPSIYVISWQFNWGIAYDLPNKTWIINERERMKHRRKLLPKQFYQRRNRRELYRKLETAVDSMGYNGRQCILRSLCESSQYFRNERRSMVEELTRSIFTLPTMKVLPFEHEDLFEYDEAFRKGKENVFCTDVYADCNWSLIEFALGRYLSPPKDFM